MTPAHQTRPDLNNRAIIRLGGATALAILGFFALYRFLPDVWTKPGTPMLYLAGVAGSFLILVPFAFSLVKRTGLTPSPPAWFVAHVVCGYSGLALLFVHSAGHFTRAPTLMLVAGAFLVVQGSWARVRMSRTVSRTFGTRHGAFVRALPVDRVQLSQIINSKKDLLRRLDPTASEALFSPVLRHWITTPVMAFRYIRLARREHSIITAHADTPAAQKYWRALHIGAALLILVGLVVHITTVTFFAGYVAGDGPIHWWHVTAWTFFP